MKKTLENLIMNDTFFRFTLIIGIIILVLFLIFLRLNSDLSKYELLQIKESSYDKIILTQTFSDGSQAIFKDGKLYVSRHGEALRSFK